MKLIVVSYVKANNGPVCFGFFLNDFYSVINFSVKEIYKKTFHKSFK